MTKRRASIKETGEQLSPAEWERFDAAVADDKAERARAVPAGDAGLAPTEAERNEDFAPRRP